VARTLPILSLGEMFVDTRRLSLFFSPLLSFPSFVVDSETFSPGTFLTKWTGLFFLFFFLPSLCTLPRIGKRRNGRRPHPFPRNVPRLPPPPLFFSSSPPPPLNRSLDICESEENSCRGHGSLLSPSDAFSSLAFFFFSSPFSPGGAARGQGAKRGRERAGLLWFTPPSSFCPMGSSTDVLFPLLSPFPLPSAYEPEPIPGEGEVGGSPGSPPMVFFFFFFKKVTVAIPLSFLFFFFLRRGSLTW